MRKEKMRVISNCLLNATRHPPAFCENIWLRNCLRFFSSFASCHIVQSQRDPRLNEILFPFFDRKRVKHIVDTYEENDEFRAAGLLSSCRVH